MNGMLVINAIPEFYENWNRLYWSM